MTPIIFTQIYPHKQISFCFHILIDVSVDTDAAREAVQAHVGGEESLRCRRVRDGVNTTFVVERENREPDCVVKFGTSDPRGVATEPLILASLAESVPTPTVFGDGRVNRIPYFVAEYISGIQAPYPTEMEKDRLVPLARQIGSILGRMHSRSVPGVGRLVRTGDSIATEGAGRWRTTFRELLDEFANDAKKTYPNLGQDAVRLVHYGQMPPLPHDPALVPVDLHTHNLIVDSETDEVRSVIDFERCFGGHRSWALETVAHVVSPEGDEDVRQAVKEGYKTEQPLPDHHPLFTLAAVLREMRAAHMWWDSPREQMPRLQAQMNQIERGLEKLG